MKQQKDYIRLTQWIHQSLWRLKLRSMEILYNELEKFGCECAEYPKEAHRYHLAKERGLFRAAEKICQRISQNLNYFHHKAKEMMHKFSADEVSILPASSIYAELIQIEQEFGQLKYDLGERSLSVITEPVILDDIHLGPFEIRLRIDDVLRMYESQPYRIIALEPNPAGSNEDVTHPHLSNEQLCEGDGYHSIRKALQEGRLCDFFMIIAQILNTYNPDSPYVSLDDWNGVSCYDCGYTVSNDDSYYCERCNNDFCDQCSGYCKICDTTLCRGCLSECPDCQEPVCQDCFGICDKCERTVCKDCLEDGLCYQCHERKEDENEEETIQPTIQRPIPTVQSDSVGQTRISA